MLRIFTSLQNPSTSVGFEPANLGFREEHVTPRQPRVTILISRISYFWSEIKYDILIQTVGDVVLTNTFPHATPGSLDVISE